MSGLTGPGYKITQTKLNSLNVSNLTPESLYVNSIILQAQDVSLKGVTGYTIAIAPPALNQSVLFSNLKNAFVGCTVRSTVTTAGFTGYAITWI